MNKIQIEIPILLPEIPNEKDQCVARLVQALKAKKGIEDVHIKEGTPAEICIHYDPAIISLKKVKTIAKQSGADLTHRFQHLLLDVKGVRHQRHARSLSESILTNKGVIEASPSATGVFQLELDTEVINETAVKSAIEKAGLKIQQEPSEKHEHKE